MCTHRLHATGESAERVVHCTVRILVKHRVARALRRREWAAVVVQRLPCSNILRREVDAKVGTEGALPCGQERERPVLALQGCLQFLDGGTCSHREGGLAVDVRQHAGVPVRPQGTRRARVLPVGAEHEVHDDELVVGPEQLGQFHVPCHNTGVAVILHARARASHTRLWHNAMAGTLLSPSTPWKT